MGRKKPVANHNRAPATPSRRKGGRSNATTPKRRRKDRDGRLATSLASLARAAATKIRNNPRFTQEKSFAQQAAVTVGRDIQKAMNEFMQNSESSSLVRQRFPNLRYRRVLHAI